MDGLGGGLVGGQAAMPNTEQAPEAGIPDFDIDGLDIQLLLASQPPGDDVLHLIGDTGPAHGIPDDQSEAPQAMGHEDWARLSAGSPVSHRRGASTPAMGPAASQNAVPSMAPAGPASSAAATGGGLPGTPAAVALRGRVSAVQEDHQADPGAWCAQAKEDLMSRYKAVQQKARERVALLLLAMQLGQGGGVPVAAAWSEPDVDRVRRKGGDLQFVKAGPDKASEETRGPIATRLGADERGRVWWAAPKSNLLCHDCGTKYENKSNKPKSCAGQRHAYWNLLELRLALEEPCESLPTEAKKYTVAKADGREKVLYALRYPVATAWLTRGFVGPATVEAAPGAAGEGAAAAQSTQGDPDAPALASGAGRSQSRGRRRGGGRGGGQAASESRPASHEAGPSTRRGGSRGRGVRGRGRLGSLAASAHGLVEGAPCASLAADTGGAAAGTGPSAYYGGSGGSALSGWAPAGAGAAAHPGRLLAALGSQQQQPQWPCPHAPTHPLLAVAQRMLSSPSHTQSTALPVAARACAGTTAASAADGGPGGGSGTEGPGPAGLASGSTSAAPQGFGAAGLAMASAARTGSDREAGPVWAPAEAGGPLPLSRLRAHVPEAPGACGRASCAASASSEGIAGVAPESERGSGSSGAGPSQRRRTEGASDAAAAARAQEGADADRDCSLPESERRQASADAQRAKIAIGAPFLELDGQLVLFSTFLLKLDGLDGTPSLSRVLRLRHGHPEGLGLLNTILAEAVALKPRKSEEQLRREVEAEGIETWADVLADLKGTELELVVSDLPVDAAAPEGLRLQGVVVGLYERLRVAWPERKEAFKQLLLQQDPEWQDTALHTCVRHGLLRVLEWLLPRCDPEVLAASTKAGWSAALTGARARQLGATVLVLRRVQELQLLERGMVVEVDGKELRASQLMLFDPSTLVKFFALAKGRQGLECAVEQVWPDPADRPEVCSTAAGSNAELKSGMVLLEAALAGLQLQRSG